jgi:hypothetical protein
LFAIRFTRYRIAKRFSSQRRSLLASSGYQ